MSYVLAIEPHQKQAGILRHTVGAQARTTLRVVDSMDAALIAIDNEVPHLVLVGALLPPRQEGALLARLRRLPQAPQILIIPALASSEAPTRRTLFQQLRTRDVPSTGCDPAIFADHLTAYLDYADRQRFDTARPQPDSIGQRPGKSGADRREAVRFERVHWATAFMDGAPVDLVDLSVTGAQILAPMVLQPGGSVQILLSRDAHAMQCQADIVWGGVEIVDPTPARRFRTGMTFKDADRDTFERFYFGRAWCPDRVDRGISPGARRPDGKARGGRISGIFERRATQPGGMPRPGVMSRTTRSGH